MHAARYTRKLSVLPASRNLSLGQPREGSAQTYDTWKSWRGDEGIMHRLNTPKLAILLHERPARLSLAAAPWSASERSPVAIAPQQPLIAYIVSSEQHNAL